MWRRLSGPRPTGSWMRVAQFRACGVERACSGAMRLIRGPASVESGRGVLPPACTRSTEKTLLGPGAAASRETVVSPAVRRRVGITALPH
jgi:hypothetical protein